MSKQSIAKARIVITGVARLVGGKLGTLYALEADARAATTGDALRNVSSAFSADKARATVGAVYEADIDVEDGRLVSLSKQRTYIEMLDTPAVQAAALAARGIYRQVEAAKAEEKAKKSLPAEDAIDKLARIVAAGRIEDQELTISAISAAIRKRSLDLWRGNRRTAK